LPAKHHVDHKALIPLPVIERILNQISFRSFEYFRASEGMFFLILEQALYDLPHQTTNQFQS
jgi:hypothetical protein